MSANEWLLNRDAIAAARRCIESVQQELGIRLGLSHPEFIELLKQYVELTGSVDMRARYNELMEFAAGETLAPTAQATSTTATQSAPDASGNDETVEYRGKHYKRFRDDGAEFQGLYRGQPRFR